MGGVGVGAVCTYDAFKRWYVLLRQVSHLAMNGQHFWTLIAFRTEPLPTLYITTYLT